MPQEIAYYRPFFARLYTFANTVSFIFTGFALAVGPSRAP